MNNELLLSEYDPVSMQRTPVSYVPKPKFPVFDAHIHIGALQVGDDREEPQDIGVMVRCLKECGVIGAINLKMFWGKPLKDHLESLSGFDDLSTHLPQSMLPVLKKRVSRDMWTICCGSSKRWGSAA